MAAKHIQQCFEICISINASSINSIFVCALLSFLQIIFFLNYEGNYVISGHVFSYKLRYIVGFARQIQNLRYIVAFTRMRSLQYGNIFCFLETVCLLLYFLILSKSTFLLLLINHSYLVVFVMFVLLTR